MLDTQGQKVVRIVVPRGLTPPYAMDESGIYIRSEAETTMAVRDEIVELTRRGLTGEPAQVPSIEENEREEPVVGEPALETQPQITPAPPRTGVEIADVTERNNTQYYTMRDLRNGSVINNVTKRSARNLWRYAIEEAETNPVDPGQVRWLDNIGVWKQREYRGRVRWDLVQKDNGTLRVYYGVTEEGIHDKWAALVGEEA